MGAAGPETSERPEITPALALEMRAYRNARYHEDRQAFFESAGRWANFVVVLTGSGAAATAFAPHHYVAAMSGAVAAVIGAAQLVFDFSGQARTHLELKKAFLRILKEATIPDVDVASLNTEMVGLYENEPNVFHAANVLAYNAAQIAYDRGKDARVRVSWLQKTLRHFRHYDPSDFDGLVSA